MPGGSSNLYIMMHIRGHASDYDNWAYNGCPGWSYAECVPYFTEARGPGGRYEPDGRQGAARSSRRRSCHSPNPTSQAFLEACYELGFPTTDDFNGPQMEGAGWHHINVRTGSAFEHEGGLPRPGLVPLRT